MDRVERYFEQVKWLPQEIKELELRMKYIREQADSISSVPFDRDFVSGTRDNRSKHERMILKLSEMEQEVARKMELNLELQAQMDLVISRLESRQDQQVLRLHYLHNMKWERIGLIMNCAGKTAQRWCELALSRVSLPADALFIEEIEELA